MLLISRTNETSPWQDRPALVLPSFCPRSKPSPKDRTYYEGRALHISPFRPRNVNRILTREKTRCYKAVTVKSVDPQEGGDAFQMMVWRGRPVVTIPCKPPHRFSFHSKKEINKGIPFPYKRTTPPAAATPRRESSPYRRNTWTSSRHLDNSSPWNTVFFTQTSHVDGQVHNKIFFFFHILSLITRPKILPLYTV